MTIYNKLEMIFKIIILTADLRRNWEMMKDCFVRQAGRVLTTRGCSGDSEYED